MALQRPALEATRVGTLRRPQPQGSGVMVLHAVARFGESWRRSNGSTSRISQYGAGPESDAGTFPLAPGLLLYVPVSLLGNLIGLVLRYPDIGSAVLFPPYAALTAALVVSSRRHWVWYILVGSATHFAM